MLTIKTISKIFGVDIYIYFDLSESKLPSHFGRMPYPDSLAKGVQILSLSTP